MSDRVRDPLWYTQITEGALSGPTNMSLISETTNTERWTSEVDDVFSDREYTPTNNTAPSLNSTFKELNERYKQNIKSWWEIKSLENYVKNNIVPQGLRIGILPAPRVRSPALMKKWEQEVTSSSLRLMNLLLEEERINLGTSNIKLKETIDIALTLKGEGEFSKKETELQNNIDKFTSVLKERKHKQFVKDLSEFRENRAYLFVNRIQQRGGEQDVSSSDTDGSENERRRYPKRSPYKTRSWGKWGNAQNQGKGGHGGKYQKKQTADLDHGAGSSSASGSVPPNSTEVSFLEKAAQDQPKKP